MSAVARSRSPARQRREWQGHELSSWWARVGAEIIDLLVVSAIVYPLGYVLGFPFGALFESDVSYVANRYELLFGLLSLLPALAYFVPVMTFTNGQTLGKRAVGIRVVRADLKPMTAGVAALREGALKNVVGVLSLPVYVLNVLWPLGDRQSRALHDIAASTRVIRDESARARHPGSPPSLP